MATGGLRLEVLPAMLANPPAGSLTLWWWESDRLS